MPQPKIVIQLTAGARQRRRWSDWRWRPWRGWWSRSRAGGSGAAD